MKNKDWHEIKDLFYSKRIGKLFIGDTENTIIQFFRYCFVGGTATLVDWSTSSILFYLIFQNQNSVSAVLSNIISFILGLTVNYVLSKFWIFKSSKVDSNVIEFIGFACIGLVGLILTMIITKLFALLMSDFTNIYQISGKIVSTVVAFFWNFFARKYLLFKK